MDLRLQEAAVAEGRAPDPRRLRPVDHRRPRRRDVARYLRMLFDG